MPKKWICWVANSCTFSILNPLLHHPPTDPKQPPYPPAGVGASFQQAQWAGSGNEIGEATPHSHRESLGDAACEQRRSFCDWRDCPWLTQGWGQEWVASLSCPAVDVQLSSTDGWCVWGQNQGRRGPSWPGSFLTPRDGTVKGTVDTGKTSQKASIPAKTWMYPHKRGTIPPANTCKVYLHGTDTEWGRLVI